MDKPTLGQQLAALRPVVEKICDGPDCGAVYKTMKPRRSRFCSDRCRFRAANAQRRAKNSPKPLASTP